MNFYAWCFLSVYMFLSTSSVIASSLQLTKSEQDYLQQLGGVRYCIDPDWMPFESIDRHGMHIGASADFVTEFERLSGVPWRLVKTRTWAESVEKATESQCHVLLLAVDSEDRRASFIFTRPYVSLPVVVIGARGMPFVDGVTALEGKTVSLVEGYVLAEFLSKKYPELALVFQNNLLSSLRMVAKGDADATLAALPTALFQIQKNGLTQLEIAGYTEFTFDLSLAVNNQHPQLSAILNKLVVAIDDGFVDRVLQRWYQVEVKQATDYKLLIVIVALLSVIVAFLVYRNRVGNQFSQQLAKVNARLVDRNARLEQLSKHDYLTGVLNRQALDRALDKGIDRFVVKQEPFSIIMFDINRFSQLNLSHGHEISDLILVELCHLLDDLVPDWALWGRWEGGRFLVVCQNTIVGDASDLGHRMHAAAAHHRFQQGVQLTLSGVCYGCDEAQNSAQLIRRLELALFEAKQQGGQPFIALNNEAAAP